MTEQQPDRGPLTPIDEDLPDIARDVDEDRVENATEPGAEAPAGSGIEGADDILETDRDRDRDPEDASDDAADLPDELAEDEITAAEQGNREGDEMISEGDDLEEEIELDPGADR